MLTDDEIWALWNSQGTDDMNRREAETFARAIETAVIAKLQAREPVAKHMVNRFLGWKLPQDFYPDSYVSFDREKHDQWGGYPNSWPTGTNLLTADQAKAMFEYCLEGAAPVQQDARAAIAEMEKQT